MFLINQLNRKSFDLLINQKQSAMSQHSLLPSQNKQPDDITKPAKAVQQNFLFITHAHLDHIVCSFFIFWFKVGSLL